MLLPALPPVVLFEEQDIGRSAPGTRHTVGPAPRYHVIPAVDRVREVDDCFLECGWLLFHSLILAGTAYFVNYIIALIRDETPFTGPTGETRHYEYIFVPVFAVSGQVEAVAGSTRDITDRKHAEEEELARQEAQRESAKLESLGIMAGGIAHDFNNLLTGVLGHASFLVETAHHPHDREIAGQIVFASERAAELTRQMLAYAGSGRFLIEAFEVNTFIRENISLLRASLLASADLDLELNCGHCFIEADRAQIQQVVMNLLINASEATGGLPGRITVRTELVERWQSWFSNRLHLMVAAGAYVLIEVADNGCGMGAETLKKLFDPFFTTKFFGRGLGLAAVLGIVKGHRGDIEVESQTGTGTVFRVYLPTAEGKQTSHTASVPIQTVQASGRMVLVVDDEDIVLRMAKAALQFQGFSVETATNGAEALQMLEAQPGISLVILDLTMPVMTGEQALPLIRENNPDIPIILSTGYNVAEITNRFTSFGIAGVLQKPYTVAGILSSVAGALGSP